MPFDCVLPGKGLHAKVHYYFMSHGIYWIEMWSGYWTSEETYVHYEKAGGYYTGRTDINLDIFSI